MDREHLIRDDFPTAVDGAGFDPASVHAHLVAVAAHVAALESMITALEVERAALRRRLGVTAPDEMPTGSHPVPFTRTRPATPAAPVNVLPGGGDPVGFHFGEVTDPDPGPGPAAGEPVPDEPGSAPDGAGSDEVAARLMASSLALEGADRETIRQRLESEYQLSDPDGLLDDVLERLA